MPVHRVRAEHEPFGDLAVAESLRDKTQDVAFARRKLPTSVAVSRAGGASIPRNGATAASTSCHRARADGVAFEDDELGVRRECGELLTQRQADDAIVPAVHDQRRAAARQPSR